MRRLPRKGRGGGVMLFTLMLNVINGSIQIKIPYVTGPMNCISKIKEDGCRN